jgi:hypothetical protein
MTAMEKKSQWLVLADNTQSPNNTLRPLTALLQTLVTNQRVHSVVGSSRVRRLLCSRRWQALRPTMPTGKFNEK